MKKVVILGGGDLGRTLAAHVWFEGVLISVLSWAMAAVIAAPISYALGVVTGRMFFKTPLDLTISGIAIVVWFALVVVIATVSSAYPASRAARLTVREAIAHV